MKIEFYNWIHTFFAIMLLIKDLKVAGLGSVHVTIPSAIQSGRNAILTCDYELETDEVVYSVKWYKGKREFFRYTPKEIPSIKLFKLPGIRVDVDSSNASRIVLNKVEPHVSGRFSCEVSADFPSFQTHIVSGELQVVEFPEDSPSIDDIKQYFRIGELLEANCSSNASIPAAQLEWWINDMPMYAETTVKYKTVVEPESHRETSILGLKILLTPEHFFRGRIKLQCIAKIFDIYERDVIKYIDEYYPQILANSDNNGGVHFSFISDRDAAGKTRSASSIFHLNLLVIAVNLIVYQLLANLMCAKSSYHEL